MENSIKPFRIVTDTNVLVSAALSIHRGHTSSTTARLFELLAIRDVIAVASTQTLYELADKLGNPDFRLPSSFILAFLKVYTDAADLVSIRGLDMGCKGDPDDNAFVETAVNGHVDFLVTYDHEFDRDEVLHELKKRNCVVVNAGEFLKAWIPTGSTG